MADQRDLIQALYAAIFSGKEGSTASKQFVSLEWPGLPIDPQQYNNPWSRTNIEGSAAALEDFSALVDPVPMASTLYATASVGVESVYGLLLRATAAGGPAMKILADAQAKFAATALGSLESPETQYRPSYPDPLNWCDKSSDALWTEVTVSVGAHPQVDAPPTPFATQISQFVHAQGSAPIWKMATVAAPHPFAFRAVRPIAIKTPSPVPSTHTATKSNLMPMATVRLSAPSAQLLQVRTANAALAGLGSSHTMAIPSSHAPFAGIKPSALNKYPFLKKPLLHLPDPDTTAKPTVTEKPLTSSTLQLSTKYLRVAIERSSWLTPLLFSLGGWSIEGIEPGAMSSGVTDNNPGFFPLLPVSFVVVKDVRISGNWSADDEAFAASVATGGNVAAFGPVSVSNGVFDSATLTVPGMQILAWISMPMPFLPPKTG